MSGTPSAEAAAGGRDPWGREKTVMDARLPEEPESVLAGEGGSNPVWAMDSLKLETFYFILFFHTSTADKTLRERRNWIIHSFM